MGEERLMHAVEGPCFHLLSGGERDGRELEGLNQSFVPWLTFLLIITKG